MAKVVCKRCESEKIVVVNEMVEQPNKEGNGFFDFLYTISIISAIIGLIMIVAPNIVKGFIGAYILAGSILFIILIYIFRLLQPFRYTNKTKCICLNCGHTWYLGEENENSSI